MVSAWIPIGIIAGLVSAVLYASAKTGTLVGLLVLFLLSPMPIAVAGLGWGWMSAALAAASGALIAGSISGTFRAGFVHALAIGLPAAVLSYLTLLNRQQFASGGDGATLDRSVETQWYPVGRVVLLAALMAGALAAVSMLATATDVEGLTIVLRSHIERVFVAPVPVPSGTLPSLSPDQIAALSQLMTVVFAAATATTWLIIAIGNLWLAAHVALKSGRLVRPWPDLSSLRLPGLATIAFAAATLATLLPGYPGLIASGFASALATAFLLVGLAVIHSVSRGNRFRPALLTAVYLAPLLLQQLGGLVLLAITLIGIAEPFSPVRRKPLPAPGSPYT